MNGTGAGSSSSGSNGGAIAGGVIGALVFVAVVAGGVYYFVVVRSSDPKLVVQQDGAFRASGTSVQQRGVRHSVGAAHARHAWQHPGGAEVSPQIDLINLNLRCCCAFR